MFIREATQEDYEEVRHRCQEMISDEHFGGFSKVNFVDYNNYLDKLKTEFPKFIIEQVNYGIRINKEK